MDKLIYLLAPVVWLAGAALAAAPDRHAQPLLGVDTAGSSWARIHGGPPCEDPEIMGSILDLGVNLIVHHLEPVYDRGAENARLTRERVRAIDDCMCANGLRYTLNVEHPNFIKALEVDPGVNEFAHPDGTHRWDLRMDWLRQVLPPEKPGSPALIGITYDEAEHMQLTRNQFATHPDGQPFDAPFLVETRGLTPEQSFDRLVGKCAWLRKTHYQDMVCPASEDVWPDMFHIFARAGWTIAPKLLKENLSSVVMSTALGAALQYESHGARLWASPDLWMRGWYPGHSPEALRSALMMGYWLGAEAVYVENLDWQESDQRHPDADKGSLFGVGPDGKRVITKHGQVVRDFYKSYATKHLRDFDWRGYRPRVAIIRLPDGAWGQKGTPFRDALLGNPDHPMDDISAEWLDVWPILTHGGARPGSISLNNATAYPEETYPFFVPIDSVAVFDHTVTGEVLDGVDCFVVCGHALSRGTFREIRRRVALGATCVIAKRLYDMRATGPLPGKWVIVDSFRDNRVAEALKPFLGPPNVARFRFADRVVEFRPSGGGGDRIDVTITKADAGIQPIRPREQQALAEGRIPRPRVVLNPSNQFANRIRGGGDVELYNEGMNLWHYAVAAKKYLDADGRVESFITRKSQTERTTLRQESAFANEVKADCLVALHSDATGSGDPGGGTWTFYTDLSHLRRGERDRLPYDISESLRLARKVQSHALAGIRPFRPEILDKGVRPHWYRLWMLYAPQCPSCLIELMFHTNPTERELLKRPDVQDAVGKQLADAVLAYFYGF